MGKSFKTESIYNTSVKHFSTGTPENNGSKFQDWVPKLKTFAQNNQGGIKWVGTAIGLAGLYLKYKDYQNKKLDNQNKKLEKFSNELMTLIKKCSPSSTSVTDQNNNSKNIKAAEDLLTKIIKNKTDLKLLTEGANGGEAVFKIIFLSNSVANDILYKQGSSEDARSVLEIGKKLFDKLTVANMKQKMSNTYTTEDYDTIKAVSRVKLSVSQDEFEKVLKRLCLEDLYTTHTYVMGRTYLSEGNPAKGKEYFELAKKMGENGSYLRQFSVKGVA
jgi:hypothetical protein